MTMRSLTPTPVFDEIFIKQLAVALSVELAQKAKSSQRHGPELMSIETADLYLDSSPEAIRHLIKADLLPACHIDRGFKSAERISPSKRLSASGIVRFV